MPVLPDLQRDLLRRIVSRSHVRITHGVGWPEREGLLATVENSLAGPGVRIVRILSAAQGDLSVADLVGQTSSASPDAGVEQAFLSLIARHDAKEVTVFLIGGGHDLQPAAWRYLQAACRAGEHLRIVFVGPEGSASAMAAARSGPEVLPVTMLDLDDGAATAAASFAAVLPPAVESLAATLPFVSSGQQADREAAFRRYQDMRARSVSRSRRLSALKIVTAAGGAAALVMIAATTWFFEAGPRGIVRAHTFDVASSTRIAVPAPGPAAKRSVQASGGSRPAAPVGGTAEKAASRIAPVKVARTAGPAAQFGPPPPAKIATTAGPAAQSRPLAPANVYIAKGDLLLQKGDVSGARLLYQVAAGSGSALGALDMGGTFDPSVLASIGSVGLSPDPVRAANWYRRASELGDRQAVSRLKRLRTIENDETVQAP